MKRFVFCFFALAILLNCVSGIHAQTPPIKRVPQARPLKQSQTGLQDSLHQQKQQERLELPEVVIVGKSLTLRKPEKKAIIQERPAFAPQSKNVPRSQSFPGSYQPPARAPKFQPEGSSRVTALSAGFGTYNSAVFDFTHWQEDSTFAVDFRVNHSRSDGQFRNSQFQIWKGTFAGEYRFSTRLKATASLRYFADRYGLWADSSHSRNLNQLGWHLGIQTKPRDDVSIWALLGEMRTPLKKEIESGNRWNTLPLYREQERFLRGGIDFSLGDWQLEVNANITGNEVEFLQNGAAVTDSSGAQIGLAQNTLSQYALTATRPVPLIGEMAFGLRYIFYKSGVSTKQESQVFPFLSFNYQLKPNVGVFLSYEPAWELVSQAELLQVNRFVNLSQYSDRLSEIRHAITTGFEWNVTPGNSIIMKYQFRKIKNFFIWHSNPTNHLFDVTTVPDAHLSFITIDWRTEALNPFEIRTGMTISTSGIDNFGSGDTVGIISKDIPYLEDLSVPIDLSFYIHRDLKLTLSTHYFGSRLLSNWSLKRGKSIWLMNAKVSYALPHIRFYLEGRNLINQKYFIWQGYPEMGARFLLGFEVHI